MKTLKLITLFFLIYNSAIAQSAWKKENYEKYNYQTIEAFLPVNQIINPDSIDYPLLNAVIFYETNNQRVQNGFSQFSHDFRLEACAQDYSYDMVRLNFFDHYSPVKEKKSLPDRMARFDIKFISIGENITDEIILKQEGMPYYPPSQAGYFKSLSGERIPMHTYKSMAIDIVKGWMNSPPHRANILDRNFTHLGVGSYYYFDGSGIDKLARIKSTQNFAKF